MGYLLINKFKLANIKIYENIYNYKLMYTVPFVNIIGIPLRLYGVNFSNNEKGYIIQINNEESVSILTGIDSLMSNMVKGSYNPILKLNNSIIFKNIEKINNLIKKYETLNYIDINIIKIKRSASHCYPLVYIL
tara:strand:- start:1036 stop:1437 length:402 start_codon:yes stop_codon:yes gene_type:complete